MDIFVEALIRRHSRRMFTLIFTQIDGKAQVNEYISNGKKDQKRHNKKTTDDGVEKMVEQFYFCMFEKEQMHMSLTDGHDLIGISHQQEEEQVIYFDCILLLLLLSLFSPCLRIFALELAFAL
jgi:hypothetical protein